MIETRKVYSVQKVFCKGGSKLTVINSYQQTENWELSITHRSRLIPYRIESEEREAEAKLGLKSTSIKISREKVIETNLLYFSIKGDSWRGIFDQRVFLRWEYFRTFVCWWEQLLIVQEKRNYWYKRWLYGMKIYSLSWFKNVDSSSTKIGVNSKVMRYR